MQNNTEKQRQFILNTQSVDHGDIKLATDALHATVKQSSCNCNTTQQNEAVCEAAGLSASGNSNQHSRLFLGSCFSESSVTGRLGCR